MKERERVRALFISDCHLGCKYARADELLQVLKRYSPELLFLVGDIIDGWQLSKRRIYWLDTYNFIIRRIIGMTKEGTKVIYICGNHDEFLRKFVPNTFGHIAVTNEYIHQSAGRRMLVVHGDMFDTHLLHFKWLYHVGDQAYTFSMWLSSIYNYIGHKLGWKYRSISRVLKNNTKQAMNFINHFEQFMTTYTKARSCDSIVCGHIHSPIIKQIADITYYNCGDWVESCSYIVEYLDGRIELKTAHESATG